MTLSEAIEVVGKMLQGYPNGQNVPNSYIGALASVIAQYPRCVTHNAGDAKTGVPADTRFLPTPADVVAWCEREISDLNGIVARDDRERAIQTEMKARADETARLQAARKLRPSLQQMQDKYGENWGIGAPAKEDLKVKAARLEVMQRANTKAFEAECKAAGVDPAGGVSPSLAKILHPEGNP